MRNYNYQSKRSIASYHLIEEGFLIKDIRKGLRLARRLRNLATGVLQASHYHLARHQLMELAEQIETVNGMPEEDGMNYVDRVETDLGFSCPITRWHACAFLLHRKGKTFLQAYQSVCAFSMYRRSSVKN